MKTPARIALSLAIMVGTSVSASDWPHWRGPDFNGISTEADWDAASIKQKWTANVGIGYSSVSVSDGRVYTAGWNNDQDRVQCLDAETGEAVWDFSYRIERFNNMHMGGSGCTPAVAYGMAYHMFRDGSVVALDAATGEKRWQVPLAEKLGVDTPRWKFAGSPIPHDDVIYIDVGRIVKLDPQTGETIWASENYGSAYSSPIPFEYEGKSLIAAFPQFGLVVLDAETGKELAKQEWETSYGINASSPIVDGDRLLIGSGYNMGSAQYRLTDRGLSTVWETKQMRTQMSTPVLIDGALYGFDDTQLRCLSWETGEQSWAARGLGRGSLTAVGDWLVVLSESGELVIAKVNPDEFEEVKRIQVFNGSEHWIAPVFSNGRLYCRSPKGELACLTPDGQ